MISHPVERPPDAVDSEFKLAESLADDSEVVGSAVYCRRRGGLPLFPLDEEIHPVGIFLSYQSRVDCEVLVVLFYRGGEDGAPVSFGDTPCREAVGDSYSHRLASLESSGETRCRPA